MKNKYLYIQQINVLLCVILLSFLGCKKNESPVEKPSAEYQYKGVILTADTIQVNNSSANYAVKLESDSEWEAYSSENWCTLDKTIGDSGLGHIKFSVARNDSLEQRVATINFKCKNNNHQHKYLTVIQDSQYGLILDTTNFIVSCLGDTITINLSTNSEYSYSSTPKWIEEIKTKALESFSHSFYIHTNNNKNERSANIVFKNKKNSKSYTVKISQKAPFIYPLEYKNISHYGDTIEINTNLTTDVTYKVSDSSVNWIKEVSSTPSKYLFYVHKNTTTDDRNAQILFTNHITNETLPIVLHQKCKPIIEDIEDSYSLDWQEQTLEFNILHNTEIRVQIQATHYGEDCDWVQIVETKGLESSKIQLHVDENKTLNYREANLVILGKDISKSISIGQFCDVTIEPEKYEYQVKSNEGEILIKIRTNAPELRIEEQYNNPDHNTSIYKTAQNGEVYFEYEAPPHTFGNLPFAVCKLIISYPDALLKKEVSVVTFDNNSGENKEIKHYYLEIVHSESVLMPPQFTTNTIDKDNVSGIVFWGDGSQDEYTPYLFHKFNNNDFKKTLFDIYGSKYFHFDKINSISEITIYTSKQKKGNSEDIEITEKEWD